MAETFTLHDLAQWAGLISVVLGLVWWFQRDSRARKTDAEEIATWKTNVERDIEALRTDLGRHERSDDVLYNKIDGVRDAIQGLGDRLLKIETLMGNSGGKADGR